MTSTSPTLYIPFLKGQRSLATPPSCPYGSAAVIIHNTQHSTQRSAGGAGDEGDVVPPQLSPLAGGRTGRHAADMLELLRVPVQPQELGEHREAGARDDPAASESMQEKERARERQRLSKYLHLSAARQELAR